MIWLLILTIAFFVFVVTPVAYIRGLNVGASQPKAIVYDHQHVWGKWEEYLHSFVSKETGEKLYAHSAQRRYCEDCGFKEIKLLSPK